MRHPQRKISWFVRLGLILICGCLGLVCSGWPQVAMSPALAQSSVLPDIQVFPPGTTTDRVPRSLEVGQSLYVQNCGRCHLAIPPAVFPSQTWDQLLVDTSHYGAILDPILEPEQSWMRRYLRFSSRTLREGESTPYRFRQSRYFRLLHPQVELPSPMTTQTCITCHTKAKEFNFRQ